MTSPREPALQLLLDRAEIHDLLMRYAFACDRREFEVQASCFVPDVGGTWGFGPIPDRGHDDGLHPPGGALPHDDALHGQRVSSRSTGTRPACKAYSMLMHRATRRDGTPFQYNPSDRRYSERLERREGRWLIVERNVEPLWAPTGVSAVETRDPAVQWLLDRAEIHDLMVSYGAGRRRARLRPRPRLLRARLPRPLRRPRLRRPRPAHRVHQRRRALRLHHSLPRLTADRGRRRRGGATDRRDHQSARSSRRRTGVGHRRQALHRPARPPRGPLALRRAGAGRGDRPEREPCTPDIRRPGRSLPARPRGDRGPGHDVRDRTRPARLRPRALLLRARRPRARRDADRLAARGAGAVAGAARTCSATSASRSAATARASRRTRT